ncbi:MAG: SAM-dependent methyltransferase [Gammaproteobacteria bacterium CG11_big_fil_rev_8_21_14_0_20_46_22]|nr:MAG: SAM-dependent methyltransferase [Gammaproteobacteria bacterium CG12_big_fil_rev_8_21_14_0_65_46_12]PIR11212.1 MAG: SAM-dependent methyltransferase [Gammaproteobacteria bacterium CG11_big_fil_rev_8_21_14_0_20_46_22]
MTKDLFSNQADLYARYRPDYPRELFEAIAQKASAHESVWDCATGNGQAAVALADYFDRVEATDLSQKQIDHAASHPKVHYFAAPAEASGLADSSQDCVTVAQALHWFAGEPFYREVRRVLKPGGVFAAWTYALSLTDESDIADAIVHFYKNVVGPYWDRERQYVDKDYLDLPMPFSGSLRESFSVSRQWSLEDYLGYMSSWSAVQNYIKQAGVDPVSTFARPALEKVWAKGEPKDFGFNITLVTCRA